LLRLVKFTGSDLVRLTGQRRCLAQSMHSVRQLRLPVPSSNRRQSTSSWRWQARFATQGAEGLLRHKTHPPGTAPLTTAVVAKALPLTCAEPPEEALITSIRGIDSTNRQSSGNQSYRKLMPYHGCSESTRSQILGYGRLTFAEATSERSVGWSSWLRVTCNFRCTVITS
jgi:hypothetical protein